MRFQTLRGMLLCGIWALAGCSTTEQEVAEQIEVLAANEIGSEPWEQSVDNLVQIGRPAARQLMTLLDPALYLNKQYREYRDEIEKTRTGAAVALGRIRHKAAAASLSSRIAAPYTRTERLAALRAVGELGFERTVAEKIEKELVDDDRLIRLYAGVALIKMGEMTGAAEVRSAILGAEPELSALAVEELEKANYYGVPMLVELADRDGPHQNGIRKALTSVSQQLIVQLKDDGPETRMRSAEALGIVGDPESGDALAELLDDKGNVVRFTAASALARLEDARGIEFLFQSMRSNDAILRVNAVTSLTSVQQASGAVEHRLLEALSAEDALTRAGAAQVLGRAGIESAASQLVAATADEDPQVRWSAVIALGRIRAPGTRAHLESLLDDSDATVSYYAEWALRHIGAG